MSKHPLLPPSPYRGEGKGEGPYLIWTLTFDGALSFLSHLYPEIFKCPLYQQSPEAVVLFGGEEFKKAS